MIIVLRIYEQEDFHRPEIPLEKTREIDNETRISKKAKIKRKFNRNQKHIIPWDIQLSCLTSLSKLNEKGISNIDYAHAQKVWKVFEVKSLRDYHGFYVHCDTLLLADVFENFRGKCIEICELGPAPFVSAPGIAWQSWLKKTGVTLELLTDLDM